VHDGKADNRDPDQQGQHKNQSFENILQHILCDSKLLKKFHGLDIFQGPPKIFFGMGLDGDDRMPSQFTDFF
jgi:hypothetical protein